MTNIPQPARASEGVAWITGASSGIGAQLALELAQRGWVVAVTARDRKRLKAVCESHEHIHAFSGDVTDRAAIARLVGRIEAKHGPIALAVLNAGIYLPTEFPEFSADIFDQSFNVNVGGVVNGLACILPRMRLRAAGQVAIVSSVAGFGGLPTSAAYGATKAALNNMAEALAMEMAGEGILINLITPGFVDTPATESNKFAMPFILPVDQAAKRIADGLARGDFLIAFPRRFVMILRLINLLPRNLYVGLFKFFVRRR